MKLSKRIPARTETIHFNWCKKDFMVMNQRYRQVRARARMRSPMDTCFWCKHKLKDGEMMALAQPRKGKNKALCQDCADILLASRGSAKQEQSIKQKVLQKINTWCRPMVMYGED